MHGTAIKIIDSPHWL